MYIFVYVCICSLYTYTNMYVWVLCLRAYVKSKSVAFSLKSNIYVKTKQNLVQKCVHGINISCNYINGEPCRYKEIFISFSSLITL